MEENVLDVVLLRDILSRELDTINNYQALLARAATEDVVEFIRHIIDEEKEHVAEAMELINRIDPRQAARFGAGSHYRKEPSGEVPALVEDRDRASLLAYPAQFTVGSLRNEK